MQYIVSSYQNVCSIWTYVKRANKFNIQSYDLKEINMSDGPVEVTLCLIMKSLNLVGKETMPP